MSIKFFFFAFFVMFSLCIQRVHCDEVSFVEKTENSIQRAYNATEKGVTKVAKATANGVEKGAKATKKNCPESGEQCVKYGRKGRQKN